MPELAAAPDAVTCRGERFKLYLSEEQIQSRIRELGEQIAADYADVGIPILIGVLNGAFMFTADLMRAIPADSEVDFYKLSSYGERKVSSGQVTELKNVDAKLEGRHVIVVEDIVDTGLSMKYVLDQIEALNPASLRSATLLRKPEAAKVEVDVDYVGFDIDNLFVIGYGLDYGQLARNLRAIYILDEEA
ncbi:hypoxanthine phosphoribosyltransferase [Rubrivirga marina]|uniref:Hypoxanthine phosphoribosyltransferase n=1 Tax=Rubrivirga marina TaxID=1196024 RepID=A0A271J100_9BACT|nr:hypoxanthine phosphoribosyltransferase [Rubrivirga marina]PAP77172.1 hypoxanthine phosphoribosyltransferase [Rubrivirga marina]